MGDVAMTVPIVKTLAEQYPNVRITMLSKPFARAFFENMPSNVGFMAADIKNEYRGVKGLNALYRRLSAKHFTAIADLHDTLRSKYLCMRFNLNRNRVEHVNKHKHGKRLLTSQTKKRLCQQPTAFQNYADVFERLGYPIAPTFTSIFQDHTPDLTLLPDSITPRQQGETWLGIAPFAAHNAKVYPPKYMEEVIRQFSERKPNSRIFLFGAGKTENVQLNEWTEKFPNCHNASALLGGLSNELILMSQLDVMLSMDSANMHLASLVGTPVVSIWGATHPYAGFMGWQQSPDNVVQVDLSCRPCSIYGARPCFRGDYACLNSISPEMVVAKILNALA